MIHIELITHIHAPAETCFNLSRSVDAHLSSLSHTSEKAIAGRTSGLLKLNDTVTWEARHFGFTQHMTIAITAMQVPNYFCDEQVKGPFKSLKHHHYFEAGGTGTIMRDVFECAAPLGFAGKIAEYLFLKKYMTRLLLTRNEELKKMAEAVAEKPGE
ncbi:MAG: SRPBCC family protein [Bacteroidetes bacterium]|nr:SRPBCC family protein [Bacteroidota bacterium]